MANAIEKSMKRKSDKMPICSKCFKEIDFKCSWCKLEQFYYHLECFKKAKRAFLHNTRPDYVHSHKDKK